MNFIKTKILGYIRNNWQLKLTSLLLAIIVWFLICEYVDPDTETYVSDIKIDVIYQDSVPQKGHRPPEHFDITLQQKFPDIH